MSKTITIEVPDETPVIDIIRGMARMGLTVKWKTHDKIQGVPAKPAMKLIASGAAQ
jgi:hypothetical protein